MDSISTYQLHIYAMQTHQSPLQNVPDFRIFKIQSGDLNMFKGPETARLFL